ncbi:MAG TPA: hypothetical protein VL966_14255 [Alphaproteobacteria bacterium]|jgi:hypothetical protein|nr:hypothetical protein [Alphaproteobacteria bacterium]
MSDRHDVLNARYWMARAQHLRDLTARTSDRTSLAAYVRLMHMYERLAEVTRADRRTRGGPHPTASIPLLTRHPPKPPRAA